MSDGMTETMWQERQRRDIEQARKLKELKELMRWLPKEVVKREVLVYLSEVL